MTTIKAYQKATMLCCGQRHTVEVHGELSAYCKQTLFGGIEIESPAFRPLPDIQTFICPVCGRTWSLAQADINYHSGLLDDHHAASEAVYGNPGEPALFTATELIRTAFNTR